MHDAAGNQTTIPDSPSNSTAAYDVSNHMTSLGGATLQAGYYADGQRMWKMVGGVNPTYFLSDGSPLPLCEFDGSGNVTAFNTVGANGLLSRSVMSGSTATTTYYAFDFRGNTRQPPQLQRYGALQRHV